MNKKFVWEYHVDPLGSNIDDIEWPGFDELPETIHVMDEEIEGDLDMVPFDPNKFQRPNPIQIVGTKFGFLTLTEHSYPSKHFELWNLITNFNITSDIAEAIEKVPGVETFNLLSRYRAKLGFPKRLLEAKVFDTTKIKQNVEHAILDLDNDSQLLNDFAKLVFFDSEVRQSVYKFKQKLNRTQSHWVFFVLPNGHIESVSQPTKTKTFDEKVRLFRGIQKRIGGAIFLST